VSTTVVPPAVRAITATVELLQDAGIPATRDAGAFFPQPVGVLVGLPTLLRRTQAGRVYTIPVLVVSGDPLNDELPVDRLYALADDVALELQVNTYRPTSYQSGVNAEPLPAIELVATASVTEQEET
jgi:hypothetical protein